MRQCGQHTADWQYAIGRFGEDTRERVRISKAEYDELRACRPLLLEVYYIEERFDVLLRNYEEFEAEILRLALQHSLQPPAADEFPEQRRTLTRRVLNLLASCRYYHDQLCHSLSVLFGKESKQAADVKARQSEHYDGSFSYRLMEQMRNVLQHFINPIRSISTSHQRTSMGDSFQFACTITPQIDKVSLLEDKKILTKLGADLAQRPETMDLKPLIREYIELIADGHVYVRSQIQTHVEKWEAVIQSLNEAYLEAQGTKPWDIPIDLEVCRLEAGEVPAVRERAFLPNRVIELRRQLERRNTHLANLSRRYVTNQPESKIPKP